MTLDRLWAAWRSSYVTTVPSDSRAGPSGLAPVGTEECVFCALARGESEDAVQFIVHEEPLALAVLNAYPYASGHLLVMPRRHVRDLTELEPEESAAVWATTCNALVAIGAAYAPDGLNLGANLGRAAGAGIPDHVHLHALPRWVGDTSFMTSVAEVRVLPEALSESGARLRAAWPR